MGPKVNDFLLCHLRSDFDDLGRWPFNATLLIAGTFAIAAGGAPSFVALAALYAALSVGVGGNIPIDSAVFLGTSGRCQ